MECLEGHGEGKRRTGDGVFLCGVFAQTSPCWHFRVGETVRPGQQEEAVFLGCWDHVLPARGSLQV